MNVFFADSGARALQQGKADSIGYAVVYAMSNEMLRLRKMRVRPNVTTMRNVFAAGACGEMMRRTQERSTLASCQDGK